MTSGDVTKVVEAMLKQALSDPDLAAVRGEILEEEPEMIYAAAWCQGALYAMKVMKEGKLKVSDIAQANGLN